MSPVTVKEFKVVSAVVLTPYGRPYLTRYLTIKLFWYMQGTAFQPMVREVGLRASSDTAEGGVSGTRGVVREEGEVEVIRIRQVGYD